MLECDAQGCELLPWSNLDFDKLLLKYMPKDALSMWLAVRGICKNLKSHYELVELVQKVNDQCGDSVPPQPAMLMRGAGGYVEYEILQPRGNMSADLVSGDNAFKLIHNSKLPNILDSYFTDQSGIHQSSCKRCLLHVKGGSFNLEQVKVGFNLASTLNPKKHLFVVMACCAPSQKLANGKLYTIILPFLGPQQWS